MCYLEALLPRLHWVVFIGCKNWDVILSMDWNMDTLIIESINFFFNIQLAQLFGYSNLHWFIESTGESNA